jgi:hypothetical protein
MISSEESQLNNNHYLIKNTFSITYTLLLTTAVFSVVYEGK